MDLHSDLCLAQLPALATTGHDGCGPVPMTRLVVWPVDRDEQVEALGRARSVAAMMDHALGEPVVPDVVPGRALLLMSTPTIGHDGQRHHVLRTLTQGDLGRLSQFFDAWSDVFTEHCDNGECRYR